VDGERVSLSSFNPYEVLSATWRGLSAPGSVRSYSNGVLQEDFPSFSDEEAYSSDAGCDVGSFTNENKALFFATASAGYINACVTSDAISNYRTFATQSISPTTCRLYGGIGTLKGLFPCLVDGAPSGDSIAEENWWLWECLVVNGVPGDVTVSPTIGARYFNNVLTCGPCHEAPVVTLDFIP
jgi:hypothetical protein